MHIKHHTEAIVLYTSEYKEANRLMYIFSEKFGLIVASAQGLRYAKSKLRYGLQEMSLSDISVVRGHEMWKITNSTPLKNYYFDFKDSKQKSDALLRISAFLKKTLNGEDPDSVLYGIIRKGFDSLSLISPGQEKDWESLLMMKILDELGILKDKVRFNDVLSDNMEESLRLVSDRRPEVIKAINSSLEEAQF